MARDNDGKAGLGRREALALIAGGVAVTAGVATALGGSGAGSRAAPGEGAATSAGTGPAPGPEATSTPAQRLPVAFVPHGGGPWPFADLGVPRAEQVALADYLDQVRSLPKTPPKALLVVSAHWEERVPTVMTAPRPPMLFDYYGFPDATYQLSWPAPGAPDVALRVRELLTAAGIESAEDGARGFDHGTFVPLMLTYPEADIPTIQLSLKVGLDPAEHLALGRALAPLRDEGVFIIGSGMTFHNMRAFRSRGGGADSETFDRWLRETATAEGGVRDQRLNAWSAAPGARMAHPREEHLIPLMVIAGAAGDDRGVVDYNGTYYGLRLSAYHFG